MLNTTTPSPSLRKLDSSQRLALGKTLDEEICDFHCRRNKDQAQIVDRLAVLKESRAYLSLGFPSIQAYAKQRLGWGAGKVKALLELHARLPRRPLLREAFEAGEVDWSKAVLAARATELEPEREADWLKAAQELSSRELEARVCGKTGEEVRRGRWFELSAWEESVLEAGLAALRSEGLDLKLGPALAELIQRALQGGSVGSSRTRFLLYECVDCGKTTHPTGTEDVPVDPAVAERLRCDTEIQDTRVLPARVTRTIPPSVKNEVLARSKGICEFPGCYLRAYLELHHIEGRGRGHDPDYLLNLCAGHHAAPHDDEAVKIEGSWSTGVRFSRADGSLIGTVGGHVTVDSRESRDSASAVETTVMGADSRENCPDTGGTSRVRPVLADSREAPKKPLASSAQERHEALSALKTLEFPARQAKLLLRQALAEQPGLRTASAEELVRAVLLRHAA